MPASLSRKVAEKWSGSFPLVDRVGIVWRANFHSIYGEKNYLPAIDSLVDELSRQTILGTKYLVLEGMGDEYFAKYTSSKITPNKSILVISDGRLLLMLFEAARANPKRDAAIDREFNPLQH